VRSANVLQNWKVIRYPSKSSTLNDQDFNSLEPNLSQQADFDDSIGWTGGNSAPTFTIGTLAG